MNSETFGLSSAWDNPNREIRYRCSFNIPASTFIPISPIVVYNDVLDTMSQTWHANFDSSILSIDISEESGCDNGLTIGCVIGKKALIDIKFPTGSAIAFDDSGINPEDYETQEEYEIAYQEALDEYNAEVQSFKQVVYNQFISSLKGTYVDIEVGCVTTSQIDIYNSDTGELLDIYEEIWYDNEDGKGYKTVPYLDYSIYEGITIEEVRTPTSVDWVHLDRYKIYSVDVDDDYTIGSLTCYDKMSELSDKMKLDRASDGTVESCVQKIETKYGLETGLREPLIFPQDENITCTKEGTAKQLLGWLAGLMGYNVKIHYRYSSNCYVLSFFQWEYGVSNPDPSAQWNITNNLQYIDECSFDNDYITFDTLKCNGFQSGNGKKLMNINNPFITSQSIINTVNTRCNLQYTQYSPFEVKWIGTPSLLDTEKYWSIAQGPNIVKRICNVEKVESGENIRGYIMSCKTHISNDDGFTQVIKCYKSLTQALYNNGITTTQSLLETTQKIGSSMTITMSANYTVNKTSGEGTTSYYQPNFNLYDDASAYLSYDSSKGIKIEKGVSRVLIIGQIQTNVASQNKTRGIFLDYLRDGTLYHLANDIVVANQSSQCLKTMCVADVKEGDVIRLRYFTQALGSITVQKDAFRTYLSVVVLG